jgi:hypothetical protein
MPFRRFLARLALTIVISWPSFSRSLEDVFEPLLLTSVSGILASCKIMMVQPLATTRVESRLLALPVPSSRWFVTVLLAQVLEMVLPTASTALLAGTRTAATILTSTVLPVSTTVDRSLTVTTSRVEELLTATPVTLLSMPDISTLYYRHIANQFFIAVSLVGPTPATTATLVKPNAHQLVHQLPFS